MVARKNMIIGLECRSRNADCWGRSLERQSHRKKWFEKFHTTWVLSSYCWYDNVLLTSLIAVCVTKLQKYNPSWNKSKKIECSFKLRHMYGYLQLRGSKVEKTAAKESGVLAKPVWNDNLQDFSPVVMANVSQYYLTLQTWHDITGPGVPLEIRNCKLQTRFEQLLC